MITRIAGVQAHHPPLTLDPRVADPYVKVEMYVNGMREGKAKCKVRQNTQDPVWHHQVVFEINRENPKLLGHVFVFHMLHKDMMTGVHKIGQVRVAWCGGLWPGESGLVWWLVAR